MSRVKRIIIWMLVPFLALTVLACKSDLPMEFDSLLAAVNQEGDNYSEQDWIQVDSMFAQLCRKYDQDRNSLNSTQQQAIDLTIGKIIVARFESFVAAVESSAANYTKHDWECIDAVHSYLTGVYEKNKSVMETGQRQAAEYAIGDYVVSRYEAFLASIDPESNEYKEDDWAHFDADYSLLTELYDRNKNYLNADQRQVVESLSGKYEALLVKGVLAFSLVDPLSRKWDNFKTNILSLYQRYGSFFGLLFGSGITD